MMKRTLFVVLFAALVVGGMSAQDGGLKRSVLFTLGEDEEICYNEYFAAQYLYHNRFVCIVENTRNKTLTLVVNGKRVQTVKGTYKAEEYPYPDIPISVFYFDPTKEDGYGYCYKLAGRYFINIGGQLLPDVSGYVDEFRITKSGKIAFEYYDGYYWNVYVEGKTLGSYRGVSDLVIVESEKSSFEYGFITWGDDKRYVVNGREDASRAEFENISDPEYDYFRWTYRTNYDGDVYTNVKVFSPDRKHIFFSDYGYEYVVIDGEEIGHSPAINAWYNEGNRSFGWSSIEGRELVVYEYRLD